MYLYIYISEYLYIYISIYLHIYISIYLYIYISMCINSNAMLKLLYNPKALEERYSFKSLLPSTVHSHAYQEYI